MPLWLCGLFVWIHAIVVPNWRMFGGDSIAYYVTRHHEQNLYWLPPLVDGAYLYSPAFAQAIWPLTWLPWPVFMICWMVAEAAVLAWLLAPLGWWRWGAPVFLILSGLELPLGNVYVFLALAAAAGLRHPAAWAFPLLTKITPGVGVLWFVGRREWRRLGTSMAVTAAIAAVSWLMAPHQWVAWFDFLRANGGGSFLFPYPRYAAAAALVLWGSRRDKPWVIPVGMALAMPLPIPATLTVLAAIPRLSRLGQPDPAGASEGALPVVSGEVDRRRQ